MALAGLRQVTLSFGGPNLLENADLQIEEKERVCLLGRNGSGKSTLLKLLNGDLNPDSGKVETRQGATIRMLPQKVPQDLEGTVYDLVAEGVEDKGELLKKFHEISNRLSEQGDDDQLLSQLNRVQNELDAKDGWILHQNVEEVIDRLKLDAEAQFSTLSGGMKRRVLLAQALAARPDLLLLDEPTNHLDIDSIRWLEEFLQRVDSSILFVTHDRRFLRKIATRIIELDRGRLISWNCDYETYLKRKEAALQAEQKQWKNFEKELEREEEWLSRTPKARKQRNMGRVRKIQEMRRQKRQRRKRQGQANIRMQDTIRSGEKVIEAKNITFRYEEDQDPVVDNFTTKIMRGDKIGIVGPNGSGKTTLIRLLLGKLEPENGSVEHGTKLRVAYFDQHRAQFDEEKPVYKNVAGGKEMIEINGGEKHVIGYLEDFLFTKKRAKTPVRLLSGGERNRLLLASLFAKPSNVLVMDEPTNDLDTDTLELLEEKMVDFDGTILLVSHDREFLENVVTSIFAMEGDGRVREYVGGYEDWLKQKRKREKEHQKKEQQARKRKKEEKKQQKKEKRARKSEQKKLSYNEKKELEELPDRIEKLESEQQELYNTMSDPSFYQQEEEEIRKVKSRLEEIDRKLEEYYERWEELESYMN